jgi:HEPN domain-containing protein
MESDEEILEYLRLSQTYLEAARDLLDEDLYEPSLFNAILALELSVKSALLNKVDNNLILHQVGGLFGREFRNVVGNDICREINDILSKYNLPRYPGTEPITRSEAQDVVKFVKNFIEKIIPELLEKNK